MTISWYLVLACISLGIIALISFILRGKSKLTDILKAVWAYAAMLVVALGLLSPLVLKKYMYPRDEKVFKNADYHLLEHVGFNVAPPFYLVNEEEIPIASLYDTKEGVVALLRDEDSLVRLESQGFFEPLYFTLGNGNEKKFHLLNRYYDADCSEELVIADGSRELYRLVIEPYGHKNRCHYISFVGGGSTGDTSDFTRSIEMGYSLADIVGSTPGLEITDSLRLILDGTSLARERFGDKGSDLVFMPNVWLAMNGEITVNGAGAQADTVFSTNLEDGARIFTGFGFRTTKTMIVEGLDSTRIKLRYQMPVRKKLRNEDSKLLITSSIDVAAENTYDGVYLFNIFDAEDNINHINGWIRYGVDNAMTEMLFEVKDMKALESDERDSVIGCDTEFCLQTSSSMENAETEWVFNIHNMRETNALTYTKIIWFFVIPFIVLVCVRVAEDRLLSIKGTAALSGFEVGTYIVVLVFGVTRLILAWRSSTFVPIDDIQIGAYTEMRRSSLMLTSLFCCLVPLGMTIMAWYVEVKRKKDFAFVRLMKRIAQRITFYKYWPGAFFNRVISCLKNIKESSFLLLGSFVVLEVILFLTKGFLSERVAIIVIPMLLYFIYDIQFIKMLKGKGMSGRNLFERKLMAVGWQRPLLLLIALLMFFVGDAGFAVIFLTFSMLRLGVSVLTEDPNKTPCIVRVLGFVGLLIATFIFILYEGEVMVFAMNNLTVVLPLAIIMVFGLIAIMLHVVKVEKTEGDAVESVLPKRSKRTRGVVFWCVKNVVLLTAGIGLAVALLCVATPWVKDEVDKKGIHMKYRAEVQNLKDGEDVGDLMGRCNFKSSDITFIMRSAQNQWFLNQYLKGGEKLDTYFHIQPHSCQGSPYNTQTTDVVVTRYVKAEHQGPIVELMLLMILGLILIYCLEIEVVGSENNRSREYLAMLLYLFVIAFSVYMSATNRSVFMGQDFPFLSIQSKIAVLLPCILLFLVAMHVMLVMGERKKLVDGKRHVHNANNFNPLKNVSVWLVLSLGLTLFAVAGWKMVPSKGTEQSESQFDVSKIVNEVADAVDRLDYSLVVYQEQNSELRGRPLSEVWSSFTENSKEWKMMLEGKSPFIASLMTEFDKRHENEKLDPESLVHIRKRKNLYRMSVNKRFYFIERIIDSHYPWMGNLLAAETPLFFNFSNTNNPHLNRHVVVSRGGEDYETNIIPETVRRRISQVQIMRFDTSWTADHEPLLLIKTIANNQQYFDLESDDLVVRGRTLGVQPATRILKNDLITINNRSGRTSKTVLSWRYGQDNERYLAKNIWINGKQQLFYPLGKESMWSYQFANLVKNVYGDSQITDSSFRHRDLRVSIDYDLHKTMYTILNNKNREWARSRTSLITNEETRENLNDLIYAPYSEKIDSRSKYYLYYNPQQRCFAPTDNLPAAKQREVNMIARRANNKLRRYLHTDIDSTIVTNVLSELLQRKFNFTAVAIDGNGRIRLLFDYNRRGQTIDPNNIAHYNKFMSDMYRDGSNEIERDVLGNKALQHLNPGPGSTFKPIIYTAVTSSKHLAWNTLDVSGEKPDGIRYIKGKQDNDNPKYTWYGGVEARKAGLGYFSIAGGTGLNHDNYIIKSNNLYHSVIVLLGMQQFNDVEGIIGPAKNGVQGFPKFMYGGVMHSFDPDRWYTGNANGVDLGTTIMEEGLRYNFQLNVDYNTSNERYTNYYGTDSIFKVFFEQRKYAKQWCYAETGSLNRYQRQKSSWLSDGFVQMVSGSSPLEVSPLQVAIMGMRLASLNSASDITTLNDCMDSIPFMRDFDVNSGKPGGWESPEQYFDFYKTQVLGQMKQVTEPGGTASALNGLKRELQRRGYHMYVKTGTLNIEENKHQRIRNMLVIVSNKALEGAENLSDLRDIKYYVIYMSFRNVEMTGFSNGQFKEQIEAVVNSDLFKQYMQEGR